MRRRACVLTLTLLAAIATPEAFGWSQTYESNVTWGPASFKTSSWNSITYNYVSFQNIYGGLPQMGTTLCNTSSVCYSWRWSNTGLITDERTISYGQAVCKANVANTYQVYVRYCATGNG